MKAQKTQKPRKSPAAGVAVLKERWPDGHIVDCKIFFPRPELTKKGRAHLRIEACTTEEAASLITTLLTKTRWSTTELDAVRALTSSLDTRKRNG